MIFLTCILILLICLNIYLFYHFPNPKKPLQHKQYDVAIVLGCPTNQDGSISSFQKERMDKAIYLYQQKSVKTVLISGSNVQNEYYEAQTMAAYAIENHVSKEDILLETKARNTFENMKYAKAICDEKNMQAIIVITSPFHVRRAYFFVRKFFNNACMDAANTKITWRQKIDEYYRMWNTLYYEHKLKHKK